MTIEAEDARAEARAEPRLEHLTPRTASSPRANQEGRVHWTPTNQPIRAQPPVAQLWTGHAVGDEAGSRHLVSTWG